MSQYEQRAGISDAGSRSKTVLSQSNCRTARASLKSFNRCACEALDFDGMVAIIAGVFD